MVCKHEGIHGFQVYSWVLINCPPPRSSGRCILPVHAPANNTGTMYSGNRHYSAHGRTGWSHLRQLKFNTAVSDKDNLKPNITLNWEKRRRDNTISRHTYISDDDDTKLNTGWFKHKTQNSFRCQCPRRFWELDPEFLHTCLVCPCRAFNEFSSSSFFRPIFGFLYFLGIFGS